MKRLSKKLPLGGLRGILILFFSLFTLTTAHAQDAKELYKKGKELYEAKKYNEAFPILKTAADKGNKKAQYRVGRCYAKGKGVKEDHCLPMVHQVCQARLCQGSVRIRQMLHEG